MAKATPVKWTREHLLIALNLYCKLPFGSFNASNAVVKEVAAKMGRSASSLSMKLCNLASFDPVHIARGVKGLEGASRQDRAMWDEFHANLTVLGEESEQRLHDLFTNDERQEVDFLARDKVQLVTPSGPTETQATVKVRRGQQFFRQIVLNSYDVRCCISGINVPRLLVANLGPPTQRLPMQNTNRTIGLGILALIGLVLLYLLWPYLIGFLAVVGAAQVYRVWRKHYGS